MAPRLSRWVSFGFLLRELKAMRLFWLSLSSFLSLPLIFAVLVVFPLEEAR